MTALNNASSSSYEVEIRHFSSGSRDFISRQTSISAAVRQPSIQDGFSRSLTCSLEPTADTLCNHQAGCEERLDYVVVQIPCDPVSVLENGEPLLVGPCLDQFSRNGCVVGKRLGHCEVRKSRRRHWLGVLAR
jgi:hypothetical protein